MTEMPIGIRGYAKPGRRETKCFLPGRLYQTRPDFRPIIRPEREIYPLGKSFQRRRNAATIDTNDGCGNFSQKQRDSMPQSMTAK